MASTISTTGITPPLSTAQQPGEAVSDWVARHSTSVAAATPSGNVLATNWKSAAGNQSKKTVRAAGESDGAFLMRHILEYTTAMIEDPPI
jgi:hypothetical protein